VSSCSIVGWTPRAVAIFAAGDPVASTTRIWSGKPSALLGPAFGSRPKKSSRREKIAVGITRRMGSIAAGNPDEHGR
jgi:hypothetical protein